jgi:hypothetical protein
MSERRRNGGGTGLPPIGHDACVHDSCPPNEALADPDYLAGA